MRLRELVVDGAKHLVIWVGAGTSKWCGYPSWDELGKNLHSIFSRSEAAYDKQAGSSLLSKPDLPKLFSLCKGTNEALYFGVLAKAFYPRPTTPVYDNFLKLISSLVPTYILTTNVDEALEQHIPSAAIVQRSNLE